MGVGRALAVSVDRPLAQLASSVEGFAATFRPNTAPSELAAELVEMRGVMDRLEVVFAQAAGAFAATDEYENQGATSPIEWVRYNCRMSGAAAARFARRCTPYIRAVVSPVASDPRHGPKRTT